MSKNNTDQLFPGKHLRKPRVLVAPLDWGLGHATRCIPIIRLLREKGADVWLAGEGLQKELLIQEFPDLPFLELEGYRVNYARSAIGLVLGIFRQSYKILSAIKKEKAWLNKMVAEHDFDVAISDNRYGLYHKKIRSVFITHQLSIKSPLGKWTEKILQRKNYQYINRFSECWIADAAGNNNLAGALSHPEKKPVTQVHYTGILSRFRFKKDNHKKDHLLIILSGPEPQRSILEEKIIKEIASYPATATIVRGLPGYDTIIPSTGMIKFYNHLPADELNKEMQDAEYIIGRCGYSSIMDIISMRKKSLLVPTPGQTEQEYLATYLSGKKIIYSTTQKEFSLLSYLDKARKWNYELPTENNSDQTLETIITNLLNRIS